MISQKTKGNEKEHIEFNYSDSSSEEEIQGNNATLQRQFT
jgi:hypothetical protein